MPHPDNSHLVIGGMAHSRPLKYAQVKLMQLTTQIVTITKAFEILHAKSLTIEEKSQEQQQLVTVVAKESNKSLVSFASALKRPKNIKPSL